MANPTHPVRVLAIGDPGPIQEQIIAALSAQQEFKLVDVLTTTDKLMREVHASEPDIILIDHTLMGQPTIDIIDDLALQNPESALIGILPGEDPVKAQQVTLAGARAFLVQPFTQVNLLSTLRRVRELEARRVTSVKANAAAAVQEATRPVKTITFFGPRGGSGTTTLAVNTALALFEQTGKRVLLFEGKLFFGHISLFLNIRAQNTLTDLIPHANVLDEGLVKDVVTQHATGIHVLPGPMNVQVAQGIRPDDLYSVFMSVQKYFDYIIVDGGSTLNENTVTLMDSSDRIMLVGLPEMAALRDISQFVQIGRSLSYSQEKMMITLNRVGIPGGLKVKDVETALHHMVYAQVPDDGANALYSLNRGVPFYLKYGRSPASKAIKNLAISLSTLNTTEAGSLALGGGVEKVHQEALLASSRLG